MTTPLQEYRASRETHWADRARCINMPLEIFFGTDERPLKYEQAGPGRAVCFSCPVRRECLEDALVKNERNGLRAGFLGFERATAMTQHQGSIAAAMAAFDQGRFLRRKKVKKK